MRWNAFAGNGWFRSPRRGRGRARLPARVFPKVLYGAAHPYGQTITEETVKAITRDDVVAFYQKLFKPGRALVTVIGALKPADAKALIDRALAAWPRGGERPGFSYPAVPPQQPTTIYLVDKPGAAQSTFAIGNPGPPRNTPDYYALDVMNTILGGQFQSRLNANIREEKGYSYGVGSDFAFGKGPGPFRGGGDIVSEKTDVALIEFMKELRGIGGARPVTDEELATAKDAIVQRLPSMFTSVSGINGAISDLWVEGLPDAYYQQYRQGHRGRDEGGRGARGEEARRRRSPRHRHRRRPGLDRKTAGGNQDRADRDVGRGREEGGREVG